MGGWRRDLCSDEIGTRGWFDKIIGRMRWELAGILHVEAGQVVCTGKANDMQHRVLCNLRAPYSNASTLSEASMTPSDR